MVDSGHSHIERIAYLPRSGREYEVEAKPVSSMRAALEPSGSRAPQRVEFHLLLVVAGGSSTHMLDFTEHRLGPRSVLWARPGQVQRWGDLGDLDATAVIFPAGVVDPATDALASVEHPSGPRFWGLDDTAWSDVAALVSVLRTSHDAGGGCVLSEARRGASRHTLEALLLRLAGTATTQPVSPASDAYLAFRDAVERDFAVEHGVAGYATRLGYSVRTLSRATRAATGASPKEVVDQRILLEAKRLLAHTDLSAARVGSSLGFSDPSNFTAWFTTRERLSPAAFRASL
ncbi:helix-turn-helix domain-containing protein [Cnuibacter sp. UC19_7]|uniref:AraC family transcriptional regulator n=1 Tax=Cnuibacter sp. UC19_7 TaxID=3350166 RepID=UPI00366E3EEC